jgi:hypothetical protein
MHQATPAIYLAGPGVISRELELGRGGNRNLPSESDSFAFPAIRALRLVRSVPPHIRNDPDDRSNSYGRP